MAWLVEKTMRIMSEMYYSCILGLCGLSAVYGVAGRARRQFRILIGKVLYLLKGCRRRTRSGIKCRGARWFIPGSLRPQAERTTIVKWYRAWRLISYFLPDWQTNMWHKYQGIDVKPPSVVTPAMNLSSSSTGRKHTQWNSIDYCSEVPKMLYCWLTNLRVMLFC